MSPHEHGWQMYLSTVYPTTSSTRKYSCQDTVVSVPDASFCTAPVYPTKLRTLSTVFLRICVQEELRQEHAQRVSAQAVIEQHKQQLADLKLEASVLRQASAEHARWQLHPSCRTLSPCVNLVAQFVPVCVSSYYLHQTLTPRSSVRAVKCVFQLALYLTLVAGFQTWLHRKGGTCMFHTQLIMSWKHCYGSHR